MYDFTEETLVEQPAIQLFAELGWETVDCMEEEFGPYGTLGREHRGQVVLARFLRSALENLNPQLPDAAIQAAMDTLTRSRGLSTLANANKEIYTFLKDGILVHFQGENGEEVQQRVQVIDWNEPENNHFLLASQLWVTGEMYTRRPDLVGFVNGLPLVFIELKAAHKRLKTAFDQNLRDYKNTIPHIFWYNAFIILSNGSDTKIGSITSPWEHFSEWKKINSEGEEGIISLETVIRGTCEKSLLLDIVENFILFADAEGGTKKLIAKNHQYLGVNKSYKAVRNIRENQGKLGVFWHTQGSGKSYSMIFFSQKVLRKLPGNWSFVVVTDRRALDSQIYKNFSSTGIVTEPDHVVRADSGEHLQTLLQEDHRYVFTLIQKFQTEHGEIYPALSDRSDVIVMTDEAHRTQYDILALNMRNALPKAAFIGFTGTPLIAVEEKTREVFGDYVSVYNFKQSVEDKATVPLFYENRIPELQLTNEHLQEDMLEIIDAAVLYEDQERKLEREFAREYHLITRDKRLDTIGKDIVEHLVGRGFHGKAIVISIDKATAVKMYDKVQKYWHKKIEQLKNQLKQADAYDREELENLIAYMEETDMAVVVSQSQNEIEDLRARGAEIEAHRRRMLTEDMSKKFKYDDDPFRIVFVCAMWMTGFDIPSCSTIYLDKPMRNHTLMQAIARANRVWKDKVNGLIVDYIGIFRNLEKALAIYGSASGGGIKEGDMPVEIKAVLVERLQEAIIETIEFLTENGIDLGAIQGSQGFERIKLLDEAVRVLNPDDAVEAVLVNDDTKRRFLLLANNVGRLFKAILPDRRANDFRITRKAIVVIADKIRSLSPEVDISKVMEEVEDLLDKSVSPIGYKIREGSGKYERERLYDLSKIDFDALARRFEKSRKRIEAEKLRGIISNKLKKMVRLNKSRLNYLEKFQQIIDEYNLGASSVDVLFAKLLSFAKELNEEEQRGIAENLNEEELAIFDLLTRPDMKLSKKDENNVKKVACELLETLIAERLVLDWRKRQQTRAAVRLAIEVNLENLPAVFETDIYNKKCNLVYQHIYDSYFGLGKSVYSLAG
ncbi:MAG TPA: type I restriction endonuclease subunit R [Anaerolineae bacterium]|nr:type I restriction endonuclease subunit R [Anaerolineae bacterium]